LDCSDLGNFQRLFQKAFAIPNFKSIFAEQFGSLAQLVQSIPIKIGRAMNPTIKLKQKGD